MRSVANAVHREGEIVGQKAPFKLRDIWALRVRLQVESRVRELAFYNLGIDSELRGCDLVSLKVQDICHGDQVASRAVVMQPRALARKPKLLLLDEPFSAVDQIIARAFTGCWPTCAANWPSPSCWLRTT